jgi:flagellar basal-body rod modification protein FlgD
MPIGAVGQTAFAPRSTEQRGLSSLNSEDFFKILVAEMRQQDPLEPAKTADMISSVSQIRSIELSSRLTSALEQMASQQRTAGASELLGKFIQAQVMGPDGAPVNVAGVVTGVRFNPDGVAVLELDSGLAVRAADVAWVTTVEEAERLISEQQAGEPPDKTDPTARRRIAPEGFSLERLLGLKGAG